jgi:hypothetical protein
VTVLRAPDEGQSKPRTTRRRRPLLERTCYRCLGVFRTKCQKSRVYCERCRSRYGFPRASQPDPRTAGALPVGGGHGG